MQDFFCKITLYKSLEHQFKILRNFKKQQHEQGVKFCSPAVRCSKRAIHRINHIDYSVKRYGQGFIRWSFVLQWNQVKCSDTSKKREPLEEGITKKTFGNCKTQCKAEIHVRVQRRLTTIQSAQEILLLLTLWLISQLPNIKSNHSKWTQISLTKQRAFFAPHFRVYNSLEHQFRDDNAFSFWNTRAKFRPSEAWVLIFARACPNDITSHSDNGKSKMDLTK